MKSDFNQPLLSIIVPVRDYSYLIHPLHKWIFEVNYELCELIIVHDSGSSSSQDSLRRMLETLETERCKLIEVECNSPGLARNMGLDISTGRYTAFWDADDLPILKHVMEALSNLPESVDLIIGGFLREAAGSGEVISIHAVDEKFLQFQIAIDPGIWRMIFRSNPLAGLRFKNYLMAEDMEFICKVLSKELEICLSEKILYRYSVGSSSSLTSSKSKMKDVPQVIIDIFRMCKKQQFKNVYTRALFVKLCLTYLKNANANKILRIIPHLREIPTSKFILLALTSLRLVEAQITKARKNPWPEF